MSGGKHYPYPKHVWAPTGGWWPNPPNAKKNYRIMSLTILAVTVALTQIFPVNRPVDVQFSHETALLFNESARQARQKSGAISSESN
ncbi:uncharacterized protein V1516DRAFT_670079 [Lipomyces oligophaga]|uniref:uncharacterized protein n=1 Tax=Lipomyces oligophaga TaxID=45792 RepID=UPI0034CF1798